MAILAPRPLPARRKRLPVDRSVAMRWSTALAKSFTPIADGFLRHYAKLGLTNNEAMFVVHLLSYKWDNAAPFPSFNTLAERMGLTDSAVRSYARSLERKNLLDRQLSTDGGTVRFHLAKLFSALEALVAQEENVSLPSMKALPNSGTNSSNPNPS